MTYWFRFDRHSNRHKPKDEPADVRECTLCRIQGETSLAGRLLYCGQDVWIHANCALWSNEVYETEEGSLRHVGEAVIRGGYTSCRRCHGRGASLTCCGGDPSCSRSYHFLCGVRAGCIFTVDRAFYCRRRHAAGVDPEEVLNTDDLAVCRRVLIHREGFRARKNWTQGLRGCQLQMSVGALFMEQLGRLDEASDSLNCFLCPVGLRCVRNYWSTSRLNERVPYRLTVRQTNISSTGSPPTGVRQIKRAANGFHFNSTTAHSAKGSSVRIVPMSPRQILAETAKSRREEIDVVSLESGEKSSPGPSPLKASISSHAMPAPPAEPRPEAMLSNPPRTDSLADRLQRMSRQMMEQKRFVTPPSAAANDKLTKLFTLPPITISGSSGPSTSTAPSPSPSPSASASSNLWGGRNRQEQKSKQTATSPPVQEQQPGVHSLARSNFPSSSAVGPPARSLIVQRPSDKKPLITSVRSLADAKIVNPVPSDVVTPDSLNPMPIGQRFHKSQDSIVIPQSLREAVQQKSNCIWKTLQNTAPSPSRVIPCAGDAAQRTEPAVTHRAVTGDLKRMAATELRAPDGKRLRLMAPPAGAAAPKQMVMTRRLTDGKTLFVCVNSTGVCTPVSNLVQPTITAVKTTTGSVTNAKAVKIDRVVDRVILNPAPPPQVDGCIDEDDTMVCKKPPVVTPRKDPPKRKTRWIEVRTRRMSDCMS